MRSVAARGLVHLDSGVDYLVSGSGGWWLVLFRTGVRGIPWVRQSSALVRQELRRGTGGRS